MILGSGFTVDGAKNGCVLLYSADEAAGPWQYEGIIASGDGKHGRVWECPALVQVWCTMCFVEGAPATLQPVSGSRSSSQPLNLAYG